MLCAMTAFAVNTQYAWRCWVQYKMQITMHTGISQLVSPDALRLPPFLRLEACCCCALLGLSSGTNSIGTKDRPSCSCTAGSSDAIGPELLSWGVHEKYLSSCFNFAARIEAIVQQAFWQEILAQLSRPCYMLDRESFHCADTFCRHLGLV